MKRLIASMLIGGLLFGGSVWAFDGQGNPKKGKYLFKKTCKTCHSEGSAAGSLTPLSKTQAQWDRFFDRDGHSAKPEVLQQLPKQDLNDIRQFLYDHAADSPQPQTCG